MKARGFSQVYHLKGGILKYLEVVAPEESLWRGECFVFDRRVSVTHGLRQGSYQLCSVCRNPVPAVSADTGYAPVDCPTCLATAPKERLERAEARRRQLALARTRGERHLGGRQASPQAASPDHSGTED